MKALLSSLMIVLAVGFAGCSGGEEAAPEGEETPVEATEEGSGEA